MGLRSDWGHGEPRMGTHEQAVSYNSKEESRVYGPYEYGGVTLEQGKRSDLHSGVEACKAGGLKRVAQECPTVLIKYPRGFGLYNELINKPKIAYQPKKVHLLYGEPGTGKTFWSYRNYPGLFRMPTASQQSYWAGAYAGEETVLFDDYGNSISETLPWTFFLQVLDGYPIQYPTKGGFVWFAPQNIILTSNFHYNQWYIGKNMQALERRITFILHFTSENSYTIVKAPQGQISIPGIPAASNNQAPSTVQMAGAGDADGDRGEEEGGEEGGEDINLALERLLEDEDL